MTLERTGRVGVFGIDNPPVNSISSAIVGQLAAAVAEFERDRSLDAMVIVGVGRTFSAGGDIAEIGRADFSARPFNDILQRIEDLDRPVVAALHGSVLGGGLELAMACHYRIASPTATFGQPEVLLGFPPGSLGTQRLPRLIGTRRALDMLLGGRPIDSAQAVAAGLVDAIDDRPPDAAGIEFAESLLASGRGARRTRDRDANVADARDEDCAKGLQETRSEQPEDPAKTAIVRCVQVGRELGFAAGAAEEAALFDECRVSARSRGLQHVFLAEREAAKVPGMPGDVALRPVRTVGIVGAGTMGCGIAMTFANAGIPVVMVDTAQNALGRGLSTIRDRYEASAARGKIDAADVAPRLALIAGALDYPSLSGCDLVIEAVFENMDLKKTVCARLGSVCKEGAIIGTNTSTLDVDVLANASGRPADFLGTHFFSPANVMRLLEVVRGRATTPDVLATILRLTRRIGKQPVVSGVCYGFIGNRMAEVYMREAEFLLMEGADPAQIDAAVESTADLGMAMGPCRMLDLAGIDVGAKTVIEWQKSGGAPDDRSYRAVCRALFDAGRFGQKSGVGYYRYAGREAVREPETERLCAQLAVEHGIRRRENIPAREIRERLLYPMFNEAAAILDEGIAYRPGDIDVVWTAGYGFPRYRGGPVFMADEIGLGTIVDRMHHYARQCGNAHGYWTPSPLLSELAAKGGRLSQWGSSCPRDEGTRPGALVTASI